jgi:hypothetical protein
MNEAERSPKYKIESGDDLGAMPAALARTGQTFEQVTAWLDAHVDVGTFVIVDEADGQPACLHPWGLAGGACACECGRPECPDTEDPHADTFGNPWYRALVDLLEDPDRDQWHTPEQVAALRLSLPSVSDEATLRAALAPLAPDLCEEVISRVRAVEDEPDVSAYPKGGFWNLQPLTARGTERLTHVTVLRSEDVAMALVRELRDAGLVVRVSGAKTAASAGS